MSDFMDIAPSHATVRVWGKDVDVPGVTLDGVAVIWPRFPQLKSLLDREVENISVADIIGFGSEVVAAVIAAGLGHPGDPAAEKRARSLVLEDQLHCLTKVWEVTMPSGAVPFVEEVIAFMGKLGKEKTALEQKGVVRFRTRSSMVSPKPSDTSAPTDTPTESAGLTLPVASLAT